MELRSLQRRLDDIQSMGASLVAISSQTPDDSLSTVEKNDLSFEVLSDIGNRVAREFGIVFAIQEDLVSVYRSYGIELTKAEGDGQFELPLTATYVIERDGTIVKASVDTDYTKRLDPEEILEALKSI
ncbi:MAG: peroxiredoxin-like family protein [Pseudomonadota bacterium]